MLKKLTINNFKSHRNTNLDLKNLTVLCGANGVGKSSIVQSLLLLREAYLKDRSFEILDLKSNPVKIGTVSDAVYEFGDYDGFSIELDFGQDNIFDFVYESFSEAEKVKSFIKINLEKVKDKKPFSKPYTLNELSLFNTNFQYISAGRLGPLDKYDRDDKIVDVHKQISVIEGKAEYFVHFLDKYRDLDVIDELCRKDDQNSYQDLHTQVLMWEKYIFDGANAEIQDLGKLGYLLKYSFDNNRSSTKKTASFDAKNVGYGLSYTLPLIVAILSSKKGALIIIENPEAHLHPSGISKLTELICLAAQAGIQIIIETHSDHVINGISVQCSLNEQDSGQGLTKELVTIFQFYRNTDENYTSKKSIKISSGGILSSSEEGFFDQIQLDLEKILGF